MASHILGDCKSLAKLKIRHLGHFLKPGDFEHTSVSKVLHLAKGVVWDYQTNELKGCIKDP